MAGTNQSFSLIAIRGLRKMGIDVTPSEASSYMHLWNVIGYLLGVDETLLPDTNKEAFLLDKLIAGRHFKPSPAGKELTASLIDFLKLSSPTVLPNGFVESYMRYFLGDKVSDILEIPQVTGSAALLASLQNLNKINALFDLNKGDYFQSQYMIRMQRKKLEAENPKADG